MKILFPSFQRRRSGKSWFSIIQLNGQFSISIGWLAPTNYVKILLGGRWNDYLSLPAPPCMCFNGIHCGFYDDILLKEPPPKKKNWIPYRFSKYWISHWQNKPNIAKSSSANPGIPSGKQPPRSRKSPSSSSVNQINYKWANLSMAM